MQDSRHIRRRNDYGIRLSPVWFRMKKLVLKPIGVPLVLRLGRTVLSWKFHKLSMSTFCRTLRLLHKISLIRHRHGAISCKYTENIDNLALSGGDFAGFYGHAVDETFRLPQLAPADISLFRERRQDMGSGTWEHYPKTDGITAISIPMYELHTTQYIYCYFRFEPNTLTINFM